MKTPTEDRRNQSPASLLEQPIDQIFRSGQKILLAGCGGGYDVFGALALWIELVERGVEASLASLSFCHLNGLEGAERDSEVPNLYAVDGRAATTRSYCPEAWLSRWIQISLEREQPIWCFEKTGVLPLRRAYRRLQKKLGFDALVLVDGGIDSLLRGDERSLGTPSEDLASLAAAWKVDASPKVLACIGLGAEMRDGIAHEQVLERTAGLSRNGAFLGASALLPSMRPGRLYQEAVEYVFANQADQRTNHVQKLVAAAMAGAYGRQSEHVWLSPLLHLYWFYELDAVAATHLFLDQLLDTQTIWEVAARIEGLRKGLPLRYGSEIPI